MKTYTIQIDKQHNPDNKQHNSDNKLHNPDLTKTQYKQNNKTFQITGKIILIDRQYNQITNNKYNKQNKYNM